MKNKKMKENKKVSESIDLTETLNNLFLRNEIDRINRDYVIKVEWYCKEAWGFEERISISKIIEIIRFFLDTSKKEVKINDNVSLKRVKRWS